MAASIVRVKRAHCRVELDDAAREAKLQWEWSLEVANGHRRPISFPVDMPFTRRETVRVERVFDSVGDIPVTVVVDAPSINGTRIIFDRVPVRER
ncbi:MAG TPA: hypothetical protein VFB07_06270, partial [Vicinamibacterales bacterium]|nr:hypothetical protein [Vicinamibacterales bacterium]